MDELAVDRYRRFLQERPERSYVFRAMEKDLAMLGYADLYEAAHEPRGSRDVPPAVVVHAIQEQMSSYPPMSSERSAGERLIERAREIFADARKLDDYDAYLHWRSIKNALDRLEENAPSGRVGKAVARGVLDAIAFETGDALDAGQLMQGYCGFHAPPLILPVSIARSIPSPHPGGEWGSAQVPMNGSSPDRGWDVPQGFDAGSPDPNTRSYPATSEPSQQRQGGRSSSGVSSLVATIVALAFAVMVAIALEASGVLSLKPLVDAGDWSVQVSADSHPNSFLRVAQDTTFEVVDEDGEPFVWDYLALADDDDAGEDHDLVGWSGSSSFKLADLINLSGGKADGLRYMAVYQYDQLVGVVPIQCVSEGEYYSRVTVTVLP